MRRHEPNREVSLDRCIDRLLAGTPWDGDLPSEPHVRAEVAALMDIAQKVHDLAGRTSQLRYERKEHLWRRISAGRRGLVRRIALYRIPYLPPLWIRPEAC